MKKKPNPKVEKIFNKLAPLIGRYLNARGWSCVLVGEEGIGTKDGRFRNYVSFSFLGKKLEENKELLESQERRKKNHTLYD